MLWATREHIHFDRVISAWLISRFVDPEAEFAFIPRGQAAVAGATLFGVPGVELSSHDESGSTFRKVLKKYRLVDPVLETMDRIVTCGLAYIVKDEQLSTGDTNDEIVRGVLAIAEGILLSSETDAETLRRSLGVYDSLYAVLQGKTFFSKAPSGVGEGLWTTISAIALSSDLRSRNAVLGPGSKATATSQFHIALADLHQQVLLRDKH